MQNVQTHFKLNSILSVSQKKDSTKTKKEEEERRSIQAIQAEEQRSDEATTYARFAEAQKDGDECS